MKIGIVISLSVLLLSFVTACGVPQEDYDKIAGDLDETLVKFQSLQDELTASQARIQSLESDLDSSKKQIQSLNSQLAESQNQTQSLESEMTAKEDELAEAENQIEALQSEKEDTKTRLAEAKARVEILNDIMIPSLTGEIYYMTESEQLDFFLKWRDKIIAIGDPLLTDSFQYVIDTMSDESFVGFFLYLMESIGDVLGVPTSSGSI